ncbi:hypothetical protein KEM54_002177 [Ascosphaera aggregata]|nr:hypothetical protein KEM54_002177 [Ascosphaera aggregata]
MDIYTVLPDLDVSQYASMIRATEHARITVKDLLISDTLEIAKRTRLPVVDVRRFVAYVLDALHQDLGFHGAGRDAVNTPDDDKSQSEWVLGAESHPCPSSSFISTLDPVLDETLNGGIATRYLTEIAGERQVLCHKAKWNTGGNPLVCPVNLTTKNCSASGKTQFLLQLLLAVQLPPPYGLMKNAIYLSTESELPTERLVQLLNANPIYSAIEDERDRPSLDNIYSVTAVDLETQNHILEFQVPITVERCNIGLVVVDSIAANYRDELSSQDSTTLAERAWQLKHLGHLLQTLAAREDIAVVVSNQVYDHWTDLNEFEDPPASNIGTPRPTPLDASTKTSCDVAPVASPAKPAGAAQILNSSPQLFARNMEIASQGSVTNPHTPSNGKDNDDAIRTSNSTLDIPPLHHILSLDYQQPFFTGFGGKASSAWKTPALGVVWANQVACRIVLTKEDYLVPPTVEMPKVSNTSESKSVKIEDDQEDRFSLDEERGFVQHSQTTESRHANQGLEDDNIHIAESKSHTGKFANPFHQRPGSPLEEDFHSGRKRTLRVVFSPWALGYLSTQESPHLDEKNHWKQDPASVDGGGLYVVEFEILTSGLHGIGRLNS